MKKTLILTIALSILAGCDPEEPGPRGQGGAGGSEPQGIGQRVECDEVATRVDGNDYAVVTHEQYFARLPGDPTKARITRCSCDPATYFEGYDKPYNGECWTSKGANYTGDDLYVSCGSKTTVDYSDPSKTDEVNEWCNTVWVRWEK